MTITRDFVSTVFIVRDKKVLLTLNKKVGIWVPVGGHIEENELPCDCVIREAKEESGLDIELFNPFVNKSKHGSLIQPVNLRLDEIRKDHEHINFTYFAKVIGGEFKDISDDGQPSKWFTKEDLEKTDLNENVRTWALEILNHGR